MAKKITSSLDINPKNGIVTKKSTDYKKIENEFSWYINIVKLNNVFQTLIPKVDNFSKSTRSAKFEMEYIPANPLDKFYIENLLTLEQWKNIIKNLLKTLRYFQNFPATRYDNLSAKKELFLSKTILAFEEIKENDFAKNIIKNAKIMINEESYTNLLLFERKIVTEIKEKYLLTKEKAVVAHGNFTLDNILFLNENIIKFIAPSGYYHKQTIHGLQSFDLAKLEMCFSSKINFIASNKFSLKQQGNKFTLNFKITDEEKYNKIESYFNKMATNNFEISKKELLFLETLALIQEFPKQIYTPEQQQAIYLMIVVKINKYFSN